MTPNSEISDLLNVLCPMHAQINQTGHIVAAGGTLQKMRPGVDLIGQRFLELFELSRPRASDSISALLKFAGTKLHLRFRDPPYTALKGVIVPTPDGGAIANLSLGISVLDAVRDYALTNTDFSATDLTVEMLYLIEANSVAMAASRKLNMRLQGAMIAAEEQAFTDTLTGLKNRRALGHVLSRLSSAQSAFALLHLDLDFFKAVNDRLGHAAGDHVLQKVARVMVQETRDKDTVARVGGDEFVLILGDLEDRARLTSIAQRLISRLEEPIPFEGNTCSISASIGIALSSQRPESEIELLVGDADQALYAAKRGGRAGFRFFDPGGTMQTREGDDQGRGHAEVQNHDQAGKGQNTNSAPIKNSKQAPGLRI